FMRPPVSTCDLMTTGPPTERAISAASSAVRANPPPATGIFSRSRTRRDSYSNSLISAPHRALGGGHSAAASPHGNVLLRELRILLGPALGEVDSNLAVLPGR